MFRDVPGYSGMFHVPAFIDDPFDCVSTVQVARGLHMNDQQSSANLPPNRKDTDQICLVGWC